jgi:membrane protein
MSAEPVTTTPYPDDSGATVDKPSDLSGSSKKAVFRRAATEFRNDNLTTLAAALTYYAVLSVVPGLIVLISILGLVGRDVASRVTSQVQSLAPGSSAAFVHSLISQAQHHKSGAGMTAIVGLVIAFWSTSSYVNAFRQASNIIYGISEGRPIWKTIPLRLGVTVVAVIVLVISASIVVVSGPVANQVGNAVGAGRAAVLLWDIAKWPVLLILVSLLLAILFWASPNAKQGGIRWISPGGIFATVLWIVISALFALYVTNFSSYDRTYGSLAGVVTFLVWLWLTNVALLLGTELNAEFGHSRAIAEGLPDDVRPFAEPRDTRKLNEKDRRAIEEAQTRKPKRSVEPGKTHMQ